MERVCCLGLPGEVKERMNINIWNTSLVGANVPFYSITLDTPALDLTATMKFVSAGTGYSRVVSLTTEEAYPPFP
jgi:hypothetical protein